MSSVVVLRDGSCSWRLSLVPLRAEDNPLPDVYAYRLWIEEDCGCGWQVSLPVEASGAEVVFFPQPPPWDYALGLFAVSLAVKWHEGSFVSAKIRSQSREPLVSWRKESHA